MFVPNRIIFEKDSQKTDMAKRVLQQFKDNLDIQMIALNNNRIKEHIPGDDLYHQYREGKKTLIVGSKKGLKFQSCKPSAHYQLPLVSGCMGQCEYCYLNTMLGDKPYIKIHTNVEEILERAKEYIEERKPEITIFEGAATSDPIPVEPYTHALEKAIEYFGDNEFSRFRFVTKFNDVNSLLGLNHNGHTEIRFSINTPIIIKSYEHATASVTKRIEAAVKVAKAGYKTGFLIAPVFLYENWREDYHQLLVQLSKEIPQELYEKITFEIISHRYTTIAKNRIVEIFPETKLPMKEEERKYKYGQFGYGKYVYKKEEMSEIKEFFKKEVYDIFQQNNILYVV